MTEQSASRMKKVFNIVLCLVFTCFIWLPLVSTILPLELRTKVDKRHDLIEAPPLPNSLQSLGQYPDKFDEYLEDNFGFRAMLVIGFNYLRSRTSGLVVADKILVGRDEWFFITNDNTVDDYRGTLRLSPAELEKMKCNIEERQNWLASFGVHYLLVITPVKWELYPEYMPHRLNRVSTDSTLNQLISYLAIHSDIDLLDLRGPLREAKEDHQVYWKADIHWTEAGALVASRAVQQELTRWFPDLPVDSPDQCLFQERPIKSLVFYTGLAQMMGLEKLLTPKTMMTVERKQNVATRSKRNILSKHLKLHQKSEPENHGSKAIIFHDSFGVQMTPWLPRMFDEFYFDRQALDVGLIEIQHPDVVIEQFGQRKLIRRLKLNPHGIAGFTERIEGLKRRIDFSPQTETISFFCKALQDWPEQQYLFLKRGGKEIGRWPIETAAKKITVDLKPLSEMKNSYRIWFSHSEALSNRPVTGDPKEKGHQSSTDPEAEKISGFAIYNMETTREMSTPQHPSKTPAFAAGPRPPNPRVDPIKALRYE